jgi:hypothetical protein
MLLQIIYLSLDYISYPIIIKVDINYDKQQSLPSITLCTPRNSFITKTQIKDNYPDIYLNIVALERKYENCLLTYDELEKMLHKSLANKCKQKFSKYEPDLRSILKEIKNRNRFNATLEQLFEKTLHLNDSVKCKVHYKDGKLIDCSHCSQISSLIEVFDGSNIFGKCFVYFNTRNNTGESFISKEDYIELNYLFEIYNDIVGYNFIGGDNPLIIEIIRGKLHLRFLITYFLKRNYII